MGIKQVDLTPPAGGPGFTAITPPSQNGQLLVVQVNRTMTAATLVAVLPAQNSVLGIRYVGGGVASNAATTATVTFTFANSAGTLFTAGPLDVKGAAGVSSNLVTSIQLPNLENQPLQGDIRVTAQYAETGTASTLGGPYNFVLSCV